MHFVYITSNHTLFASHCFGGLWRSVDGGDHWSLIVQEDFVDVNFQVMAEYNGVLYGGGNKGLWISHDVGRSWERLLTGDATIDTLFYYEILSIVPLSDNTIVFSVAIGKAAYSSGYREPRNGFFLLSNGQLSFYEIPGYADPRAAVHVAYDDDFGGERVVFVSSSVSGLYIYKLDTGAWEKILDKNTTKVCVDVERDYVYVGTIGDWYYIGHLVDHGITWEHVVMPDLECAVASFIVPDPYNPLKLWVGAVGGGTGTPYRLPKGLEGDSFVATGFWINGTWSGLKTPSGGSWKKRNSRSLLVDEILEKFFQLQGLVGPSILF